MKRRGIILQGLIVWACFMGAAMAFAPPGPAKRHLRFYRQVGFHEEARWVAGRLKKLSGGRH